MPPQSRSEWLQVLCISGSSSLDPALVRLVLELHYGTDEHLVLRNNGGQFVGQRSMWSHKKMAIHELNIKTEPVITYITKQSTSLWCHNALVTEFHSWSDPELVALNMTPLTVQMDVFMRPPSLQFVASPQQHPYSAPLMSHSSDADCHSRPIQAHKVRFGVRQRRMFNAAAAVTPQ